MRVVSYEPAFDMCHAARIKSVAHSWWIMNNEWWLMYILVLHLSLVSHVFWLVLVFVLASFEIACIIDPIFVQVVPLVKILHITAYSMYAKVIKDHNSSHATTKTKNERKSAIMNGIQLCFRPHKLFFVSMAY